MYFDIVLVCYHQQEKRTPPPRPTTRQQQGRRGGDEQCSFHCTIWQASHGSPMLALLFFWASCLVGYCLLAFFFGGGREIQGQCDQSIPECLDCSWHSSGHGWPPSPTGGKEAPTLKDTGCEYRLLCTNKLPNAAFFRPSPLSFPQSINQCSWTFSILVRRWTERGRTVRGPMHGPIGAITMPNENKKRRSKSVGRYCQGPFIATMF